MTRFACSHARHGLPDRVGQRCVVLVVARRGTRPRNVLVRFADGLEVVTSYGCLRWRCEQHGDLGAKCPGRSDDEAV